MGGNVLFTVLILWVLGRTCTAYEKTISNEGSFAFREAGNRRPPIVKKPPYTQSRILCHGVNSKYYIPEKYQTLCGDLNKGFIPVNPMGQAPLGEQYPFKIIKKKALKFFAKTIPTLKKDEHVPKVAMFEGTPHLTRELGGADSFGHHGDSRVHRRVRRSAEENETRDVNSKKEEGDAKASGAMNNEGGRSNDTSEESKSNSTKPSSSGTDNSTNATNDRFSGSVYANVAANLTDLEDHKEKLNVTRDEARQFLSALCDGQDNIICTLMSLISKPPKIDKFYENEEQDYHLQHKDDIEHKQEEISGPGTPCPSYNEYVTPTYARNHHGSWRYVVQIPYEGYFTQTIQVTRCRNTNCAYLEGSCKSSPRWISLLVAEIYYPDLYYAVPTSKRPKVHHAPEHVNTSPYPSFKQNEKVNVGPFIRPIYNKTPSKKPINPQPEVSKHGPYYRPTSVDTNDQYYQSLSGTDESKDSLLRREDTPSVPISTDEFYRYQQHLHDIASAQRKSKKSGAGGEREKIKIRTKRRDPYEISPLSPQPSVLKRNVTSSNLSKNPSSVNPEHHCDGYDNLGCFVVRMYYDWFVVSGECKCWKEDSRHLFLH